MQLNDAVLIDGKPRRTPDGYLTAVARVARTGIQLYSGTDLGRSDMPVVRVYRPPESVFAADAMHSYAHRPMTNGHPAKMVDASNWRGLAIGQTGEEVVRDGEFVRVPLVMMDADAIRDFEGGKRELSMGYACEIEFQDGVTESGEQYDAIQTQLRMNHLALVDRARGGSSLKIGDDGKPILPKDSQGTLPMSDTNTRTVMVDGLSVQTTDAGAQAIAKLLADRAERDTKVGTMAADHAAAIAAKDTKIGELSARVKTLEDAAVKPADLDRMVADRATLVAQAAAIAPEMKCDGLSDADIRKGVVEAKIGADFVKDASPEQIQGAFAVIAKDAKPVDGFRQVARDGITAPANVKDNGYSASVADLNAGSQFGKTAAGAA